MSSGWRRALCTTFPKDSEPSKDHVSSPKFGSRFGFFSNPSSPRLRSETVSGPNLWCKTKTETISSASAPVSPTLSCKTTNNSPKFFFRSTPSSPKSPSSFSILRTNSRFSKSRCGICLQNMKSGLAMAIFTAECSHTFHFHCVSEFVSKKPESLICPVCSKQWNTVPLLDLNQKQKLEHDKDDKMMMMKNNSREAVLKMLKVYNDDEPLMSPVADRGFVPIPESNENEEDNAEETHMESSIVIDTTISPIKLDLNLLPDAAVVAVNRNSVTHAVVLTVKAPSPLPENDEMKSLWQNGSNRAPIDLVTVINVSGRMNHEKQQSMKRAMRFVISSLSSNDRLSIVVFSETSKRLMPLKKMTSAGRRTARRIVEALGSVGNSTCAADAVKKAEKVLEDRLQKNQQSTILVLSDGQEDFTAAKSSNRNRPFFTHMKFSLHRFNFSETHARLDDVFAESFSNVLNPVIQDLRFELGFSNKTGPSPAQVTATYSTTTGHPTVMEPGSIRFGDLYTQDERELLIELKVPISVTRSHQFLIVRSSYKDPLSQKLVICKDQTLLVPHPPSVGFSTPKNERLRFLFLSTRAVAESRRLIDRNDLSGAYRSLNSARLVLVKLSSGSAKEYLLGLEAELAELNRCREKEVQIQRKRLMDSVKKGGLSVDEKGEPLTPTSAWKAAERLAKLAIMRKSLNRVGDLHGFENAGF